MRNTRIVRTRIAAAAVGALLFGTAALGTLAQEATPALPQAPATTQPQATSAAPKQKKGTTQIQPVVQKGGAAGLVAAVVQAADLIDINDSTIEVVTIKVEDSLNNLTALNNVLNNSPVLSNNNIVLTDLIEVNGIDNLIAVGVLDSGDLIFFTR